MLFRSQSATGRLRWSITGGVRGPPIDSAEIAQLRTHYSQTHDTMAIKAFDSSLVRTGALHPEITGLIVAPDGRVMLGGPQLLTRDSADFYLLARNGKPVERFSLPRTWHVLLFYGDSILVQRATANMQEEMRWIDVRR